MATDHSCHISMEFSNHLILLVAAFFLQVLESQTFSVGNLTLCKNIHMVGAIVCSTCAFASIFDVCWALSWTLIISEMVASAFKFVNDYNIAISRSSQSGSLVMERATRL